jgi:ubiquinone/menaquinone biosynthesis C-methylase UbiE
MVCAIFFSWIILTATSRAVVEALSQPETRRDWLWKAPLAVGTAYYYGKTFQKINQISNLIYPEAHERRIISILTTALENCVVDVDPSRPLRILEVGMGSNCRLIRRGLYNQALQRVSLSMQLIGVDLKTPSTKIQEEAKMKLEEFPIDLQFISGDVTTALPFPDGFFDSIVFCTMLCSVNDPIAAVQEMNRLLKPQGGTLGFVEHVATEPVDEKPFFGVQQQLLDPLQQAVADNCHLHRYTARAIREAFPSARVLTEERFFVDDMWPVSCQCCGVIQTIG